jgi:hypothetical protein
MRRAILLLATIALTILAASGVAGAILNGAPDGNRHPYVGWASTEASACSSTLNSPTVFLTAGHCTEHWGSRVVYITFEPQADVASIRLDPDGVFDPGDAHTGTAYTHPRYSFPSYDVGVVVLDEPVSMATYGRLPKADRLDTLEKGTLLTAVGYGMRNFEVGGGPPEPTDPASRYRAKLRYLGTSRTLGSDTSSTRDLWLKARAGSMGEGGEGSCYGHSGGPFFLPDQRTIVGVISFGVSPLCTGLSGAQRVDLPVILSWVRSFL